MKLCFVLSFALVLNWKEIFDLEKWLVILAFLYVYKRNSVPFSGWIVKHI